MSAFFNCADTAGVSRVEAAVAGDESKHDFIGLLGNRGAFADTRQKVVVVSEDIEAESFRRLSAVEFEQKSASGLRDGGLYYGLGFIYKFALSGIIYGF